MLVPRVSLSHLGFSSEGLYNYFDDETEKLQIVEMPLAHKLSSMIFIMPNHVEPLERVEKLLTREQLKTWISKLKKRSVAISLPKVSLEVSHDLQVNCLLEPKNQPGCLGWFLGLSSVL